VTTPKITNAPDRIYLTPQIKFKAQGNVDYREIVMGTAFLGSENRTTDQDIEYIHLDPNSGIIPKAELAQLKKDSRFLELLECAGVSKWVGYEYARAEFEKEQDDS